MQRHKARNPSSRHMLDMAHRLSYLLAGATDPLAFLRTILQDALALTNSGGGAVLLLERNLRLLRTWVNVGDVGIAETDIRTDAHPWSTAVWGGKATDAPSTAAPPPQREAPLVLPLLVRGDVIGVLTLHGGVQLPSPRRRFLEILV